VFEFIDPEVKIIRTTQASGRRDTIYLRVANGWESRIPPI
jgi:hypothetical protein